jgi:hypothetical protein
VLLRLAAPRWLACRSKLLLPLDWKALLLLAGSARLTERSGACARCCG